MKKYSGLKLTTRSSASNSFSSGVLQVHYFSSPCCSSNSQIESESIAYTENLTTTKILYCIGQKHGNAPHQPQDSGNFPPSGNNKKTSSKPTHVGDPQKAGGHHGSGERRGRFRRRLHRDPHREGSIVAVLAAGVGSLVVPGPLRGFGRLLFLLGAPPAVGKLLRASPRAVRCAGRPGGGGQPVRTQGPLLGDPL